MKCIDVDLLLKEIEKKSHEEQGFSSEDSEYGYRSCARDLLAFINFLQQEQPEVNLEKEYKEYVEDDPVYSKLVNGIVGKSIAHHFYELGLNARKE